jgi:DNA-binding Lrp family transcriptional regulator
MLGTKWCTSTKLTALEVLILNALSRLGPVGYEALNWETGLNPSTVKDRIPDLIKRGLVERIVADPKKYPPSIVFSISQTGSEVLASILAESATETEGGDLNIGYDAHLTPPQRSEVKAVGDLVYINSKDRKGKERVKVEQIGSTRVSCTVRPDDPTTVDREGLRLVVRKLLQSGYPLDLLLGSFAYPPLQYPYDNAVTLTLRLHFHFEDSTRVETLTNIAAARASSYSGNVLPVGVEGTDRLLTDHISKKFKLPKPKEKASGLVAYAVGLNPPPQVKGQEEKE